MLPLDGRDCQSAVAATKLLTAIAESYSRTHALDHSEAGSDSQDQSPALRVAAHVLEHWKTGNQTRKDQYCQSECMASSSLSLHFICARIACVQPDTQKHIDSRGISSTQSRTLSPTLFWNGKEFFSSNYPLVGKQTGAHLNGLRNASTNDALLLRECQRNKEICRFL